MRVDRYINFRLVHSLLLGDKVATERDALRVRNEYRLPENLRFSTANTALIFTFNFEMEQCAGLVLN